ncbi:MAG: hypothetical protein FWF87_00125 [Synergistaceae bacterium]|nr:hypothetical protein [Synergistaceae bacterium]
MIKRSLADSIAVTLNVPANVLIDGETIINIFQSGELPEKWHEHIGSIFLEFKIKKLHVFMETYNIPIQNVRNIYAVTPKFYHSERMDVFLNGNMGRIA